MNPKVLSREEFIANVDRVLCYDVAAEARVIGAFDALLGEVERLKAELDAADTSLVHEMTDHVRTSTERDEAVAFLHELEWDDTRARCPFCRGWHPQAGEWGVKRELVGHRSDCSFAAFLARVGGGE